MSAVNVDPPTCSWPSAGAEGAADLRARVVVLPPSEDAGAFERRVADTAAGSSSALLRKPAGATACELVVPLPEGAAARALSLVSTARVAELYVVHPALRERAYVRTVRGADIPDANHHPSSPAPAPDASTSASVSASDPAASAPAPLFYECVSTLGADPCASVVVKLFAPADADAIRIKGVVVELCDATRTGAPPAGAHSIVPDPRAALASIAEKSRAIAGLSPGTGTGTGTGTALAAALASALGGARGAGAPPSDLLAMLKSASAARDATRASGNDGTDTAPEPSGSSDVANADWPGEDLASISRRVRRLEATALRVERVVTDAMERIEARLDAMDARLDAAALVARVAPRIDTSTTVRPPRSHTKAEWDAETRAATRERRRDE